MRKIILKDSIIGMIIIASLLMNIDVLTACSTFKLQKGNELLYGHNLNENGIDVPGYIFINKRGIFKIGRTWTEMTTKDKDNPSLHYWISKYGSVTFNAFGRDFPDGGMNETGLCIWEMNEDANYPKNDSFPKLMHMNWMQYILDNYSTLDQALECAAQVEIDGWGWHYFIGDGEGNCASLAFIEGKLVVHRDEKMPVTGLFNTPYDRELELLQYFKGFGGSYEPDLQDIKVPRFVKTAVMIRDYDTSQDAVEYGLTMLKNLTVSETPKWSVLFDVNKRKVYFKTRLNPEVKYFSMDDIDFSNQSPVLIQDMYIEKGGDMSSLFHPFEAQEMAVLIESLPLPDDFFSMGGITKEEFVARFSNHSSLASSAEKQYFKGVWKTSTYEDETSKDGMQAKITLWTEMDAVYGEISSANGDLDKIPLDHLYLVGNHLICTFRTLGGSIYEIQGIINENEMQAHLQGIEDDYGNLELYRGDD